MKEHGETQNTDIEIIKLAPEDYGKCSNNWDMSKQPDTQKWYEQLVSGDRTIYVYTIDGEFIGEGALVFDMDDPDCTIPAQRVCLSRLIVKREYRDQGIGSALIGNIALEPLTLVHSEVIAHTLNNDERLREALGPLKPAHAYAAEDTHTFFDRCMAWEQHKGGRFYTILLEGEPIGLISCSPARHDPCDAEIGYWIASGLWGQGYMTAALKEMLEVLKGLGYGCTSSRIAKDNAASIGVCRHFDATFEEDGEYVMATVSLGRTDAVNRV